MSIENKGFAPDSQKEDPNEIIIIGDHNSVGSFYKGPRHYMEKLAELGGDPWELKNPEVNEKGQVKNSVEWDEDTGEPSKIDWIDVGSIPEAWKE